VPSSGRENEAHGAAEGVFHEVIHRRQFGRPRPRVPTVHHQAECLPCIVLVKSGHGDSADVEGLWTFDRVAQSDDGKSQDCRLLGNGTGARGVNIQPPARLVACGRLVVWGC